MAYAQVQSTGGAFSGSGTLTRSFSVLPTAGNVIVVQVGGYRNPNFAGFSVSDNQGNTYHEAVTSANILGARSSIWYAYNIGSPSGTFTVSIAGGWSEGTGGATEWSGFDASNPLSVTHSNTQSNTTSATTGSTTTTPESHAVVCANMFSWNGNPSVTVETVSPAWTQDWDVAAQEANSRIVTVQGTQSCSWTLSPNDNIASTIACFVNPTEYSNARITQVTESIVSQLPSSPVRATEIVQSVVSQAAVRLRLTQVVQTVVAFVPPEIELPPLFPTRRWGLERFDIKVRSEDSA